MLMLNQPFNGQLGDMLITQMEQPFNELTIISAFAKNSGVLRMKPAMERFSQNGGAINAFIGIDAYGTSYEALLNLFHLCDSLYVIHSESPMTTFHSKIYSLSNERQTWMVVGSNNFTAGGLWTNFESASCFEIDTTGFENQEYKSAFLALIDQYKNNDYECSHKITSEDELTDLLNADYIRREARIRMESLGTRSHGANAPAKLFGTHRGIRVPRVQHEHTGMAIHTTRAGQEVYAINEIEETNVAERIWFETRAMTGGSGNQLDLSKLGKIILGSAANSRYETTNPQMLLGGVAFFDVEPNSNTPKDITINLDGIDYYPCTIKFEPNNGSWRIQLKGKNIDGTVKLHKVGGTGWLDNKILIFEKIRTDYYGLSVIDKENLHSLQNDSVVVAHNGSSTSSRLYGLL